MSADLKGSHGKVFFTLAKEETSGSFRPFFKSECKKVLKNRFTWNTVMTNSHLLANDEEERKVEVSMFEYSSSGKHKVIGKFFFAYGDLKSGSPLEPSSSKGTYLKGISMAATMSPGIAIDTKAFIN